MLFDSLWAVHWAMHWITFPVLIPLLSGTLLITLHWLDIRWQRLLSLTSAGALLACSIYILSLVIQDQVYVYQLGNWDAPFGISLVADRLSALMLVLVSALSVVCVVYSTTGKRSPAYASHDQQGAHFHALVQFQLMGLNGALLTGDMFNLFVFFEVLLIASYALLLHGGGRIRIRAGLRYVIINLIGSALFIIALGILYGVTGTLNMADMALKINHIPATDRPLVHAAGALLVVVFGIKAAILPLLFWLPRAYAAAGAPVAALFAVMTKIGIYAILRVLSLVFYGDHGLSVALWQWLIPLGLGTMVMGAVGALGAKSLRGLTAWMVILSVGTLLVTFAQRTPEATGAALFYLIHSTLLTAAFFILADLFHYYRPQSKDFFVTGPRTAHRVLLGTLYFTAAMAFAGLPPLSGFISKLLILQSTPFSWAFGSFWPLLLIAGLVTIVALSRGGSALLWRQNKQPELTSKAPAMAIAVMATLLFGSMVLSLFAQPVIEFTAATANQLLNPELYIQAVMNN